MKKISIVLFLCIINLFFTPFVSASSSAIAANEDEITKIEINDKMIALNREMNRLEFKLAMQSNSINKDEITTNLIKKYDGAEATYLMKSGGSWSEKLVNGGYNVYATNKNGLSYLRDYLGANAMGFRLNGAIYGAMIGGVIGAVCGFFGAGVLATRLDQGATDIKKWISKGRNNGGARMTASAHFPISSLNSITQAMV